MITMLTMSKKEFKRKIEAGLNAGNVHKEKEDDGLPEEMIERVTAGVEDDDIESKAEKLANKIKEDTENESVFQSSADDGKENFSVEVDTKANVRGVKYRRHAGIEITGFECRIETKTNAAVYDKCEVFLGNENDNFDVWGKYTGKMKESVNGDKKARFEFYLRGKNLTVTYWKSHKYQDKAKTMAQRAISLIKQAFK